MNDLIDRQAAIYAIASINDYGNSDRISALSLAEFKITILPSAPPGWIRCSERMPKVREWVLCSCRANILEVLRLNYAGNWETLYPKAEYMSGFVLAWMPLPEPYKGE